MVVVKNDFHPTKTILIVFGELKTNVFHFVHWESVETYVGAPESVVVIKTVIGVIGTYREILVNDVAQQSNVFVWAFERNNNVVFGFYMVSLSF